MQDIGGRARLLKDEIDLLSGVCVCVCASACYSFYKISL